MLEEENLFSQFPNFLSLLPEFVNSNLKYYSFDELCYFCRICHVHSNSLQNKETHTFWSNVNLMKEHIKITSFSRGFKIDVHSNFHKLL